MKLRYRRFFRFSLRTLLAVLTVCAVWLGYTMYRLQLRRQAIRAIDENGGTYGVYTVGPKWMRYFIKDKKCFYDAARVSFGAQNQGYNLEHPFGDRELEKVIPHLNTFERFYILDLTRSNVSDVAMRCLKDLRHIEILRLYGTKVTDDCIPDLSTLKNLRDIVIQGTAITDAGREKLHAALPNCKIE